MKKRGFSDINLTKSTGERLHNAMFFGIGGKKTINQIKEDLQDEGYPEEEVLAGMREYMNLAPRHKYMIWSSNDVWPQPTEQHQADYKKVVYDFVHAFDAVPQIDVGAAAHAALEVGGAVNHVPDVLH